MISRRFLSNSSSHFAKASLRHLPFLVSHQIRHFSAKPRFDFGGIREPKDATALFQEMLRMRPLPPLVDFTQLFGVLVDMKQYSLALQMLDEMLWRDASIQRSTFNIVMSLFHRMVRMRPPPSVFDYTKFWSGVIKIKQYSVALHLFHQMIRMDAPVNGYSLNIAINCFCCVKRPDFGFAVLGSFFKRGYEPNVVTFTTLLKGLMLVGKIQEAAKLLAEQVCYPNEVTYHTIINGLCKAGHTLDALDLLGSFEKGSCKPNELCEWSSTWNPDILVSDLLSECGEMHYVLRRKEDFPGQKVGVVSGPSLDESETSDSEDACSCKQLVHELTSLIKKKLPCKNLILSLEDMLINYLQDDTSLDGVLELEPMNSYHRMLVHHLAEIFRFSHYSVGEGEYRHVVLERNPKTSIPDFLVGAYLPPMTYDVLRRKVVFPDMGTKHELTSSDTKEFGQTAVEDVKIEYTDEKNIHSSNKTEIDFLSGKNPWACAVSEVNKSGESELGDVKIESMDERNIHSSKTEIDFLSGENPWACTVSKVSKSGESEVGDVKIEYTDEGNIHSSNKKEIDFLSLKNPSACAISEVNKSGEIEVGGGSSKEPEQKDLQDGDSSAEMKSGTGDEYLKQEHRGGAKRLFGNAFGMLHERDINLSKKTEVWQPENSSAGFDKPASVEVQDLLGRMS